MCPERSSLHFGVLPFTGTGHLNPFISLAQELKRRGHRVTFFEKPKIEDRVRNADLDFYPICGHNSYKRKKPSARGPKIWSDFTTMRFNLKRIEEDVKAFLQETPTALRQAGVNALLINEIALTGPTVAELLRLPYFIISTSVPHSFGWNAFPWFSGYRYSISPTSWMGKAIFEISALCMRGPLRHRIDLYRRQAGLGPIREIRKAFPPLAQITQLPSCLDLPRATIPSNFYYTGPFLNEAARPPAKFAWGRLDGRPIVYASLGTTRNVQASVFRLIAAACEDFDLQLVISLGGRFEEEEFADLPGHPLVTKYAPQLELLKLAKIVITHCGSNTVFEALMEGKPMIAIPLAHDQPAMAARLARLKVAEVLPAMRLTAAQIRTAITKLLHDASYYDSAQRIQAILRSLHGTERAANLIEEKLSRYGSYVSGFRSEDTRQFRPQARGLLLL